MLFDKVNTTSETFVSEYLSYHHCEFTAELLALAKNSRNGAIFLYDVSRLNVI